MSELAKHLPTGAARRALALRFGLPYHDSMQDWEWEIADTTRFGEFLAAYASYELSEDELFSLMEVLVQCIEEMPDEDQFSVSWQAVEPHLKAKMHIHRFTIESWACLSESDPNSLFRVSPNMRRLLT